MSDEYGTYQALPKDLCENGLLLCRAMSTAFNTWESQACMHPNMNAASERIANSSQMYALRSLVEE
ncbi:MAG: hypothetical protein M3Y12_12630 [Bacteroidota bacterium]|nr:hypothetical protein [Bacteroidota bacterium]